MHNNHSHGDVYFIAAAPPFRSAHAVGVIASSECSLCDPSEELELAVQLKQRCLQVDPLPDCG